MGFPGSPGRMNGTLVFVRFAPVPLITETVITLFDHKKFRQLTMTHRKMN